MLNIEGFNYETKCRRCGEITDWLFSTNRNMTWTNFASVMNDKVKSPRLLNCNTCKKHTIQDVVSYTNFKEEFES